MIIQSKQKIIYNYVNSPYRYNKICGNITKLANELSILPIDNPTRKEITEKLLSKLFQMGLISVKRDLSQCQSISVSSLCR